MKKITALMALVLIMAMLVACGNTSAETPTSANTPANTPASSATPSIAVVAWGDEFLVEDWDPAISYGSDTRYMMNVYETLMRVRPDGTYENVLCESYEVNEDGTVWTIYLPEGVTFHDGTPFNADAVKFSIDRTVAIGKGGAFIWDPLDHIEVVSDYVVEFHLKRAIDLRELLSSQFGSYIYSPSIGDDHEASSEWFYEGNECGTGPYMIAGYVQGDYILLSKFDNYRLGWEGDHIDSFLLKYTAEAFARRQMIENGDAQISTYLNPSDAEAMLGADNYSIEITEDAKCLYAFFNTFYKPLDNKIVRQAMAYCFPYENVINELMYGKYVTMPTDMSAPASLLGASESMPYNYDLEKAKALLKEAGYEDGFTVNVAFHSIKETTSNMLSLWKTELEKIGITLELAPGSWEVIYNNATSDDVTKRPGIFVTETFADTPSAYSMYNASAKQNGSWNFSGYGTDEIDAKIDEAYSYSWSDPDKYIELMHEAHDLIAEECYVTNLSDMVNIFAVSNNIEGFTVNPSYEKWINFYELSMK